jgi:hypothetical protein
MFQVGSLKRLARADEELENEVRFGFVEQQTVMSLDIIAYLGEAMETEVPIGAKYPSIGED